MALELFVSAFVSLFAIVDPIGGLSIFIGLTKDMDRKHRVFIVNRAVLYATLIIIPFALFGEFIIRYMSVSLSSLRIAGGILLIAIALRMILGKEKLKLSKKELHERHRELAVTPLATPLLAGPAAMTTSMIFMQSVAGFEKLIMVGIIVLTMLISWAILRQSHHVHRVITDDGISALEKIFGLLLAAIAIEMIAVGIQGYMV
jgi:multiple antibiotic resistance protein